MKKHKIASGIQNVNKAPRPLRLKCACGFVSQDRRKFVGHVCQQE